MHINVLHFINWLLKEILSLISNNRHISISSFYDIMFVLVNGTRRKRLVFYLYGSVTILLCMNDEQHIKKGLVVGILDISFLYIM